MKDKEARKRIDYLEEKVEEKGNEALNGVVIRDCVKCKHKTLQIEGCICRSHPTTRRYFSRGRNFFSYGEAHQCLNCGSVIKCESKTTCRVVDLSKESGE